MNNSNTWIAFYNMNRTYYSCNKPFRIYSIYELSYPPKPERHIPYAPGLTFQTPPATVETKLKDNPWTAFNSIESRLGLSRAYRERLFTSMFYRIQVPKYIPNWTWRYLYSCIYHDDILPRSVHTSIYKQHRAVTKKRTIDQFARKYYNKINYESTIPIT